MNEVPSEPNEGSPHASTEQSATGHAAGDQSASVLKPLRIWPAVVLLLGMAIARFVPGMVEDAPIMLLMVAVIGPVILGGLIWLWWLTTMKS